VPSAKWFAQELLTTLQTDLERLELIDAYVRGDHRPPFTPDNADREFKEIARRSITNLCDMPVNSVSQTLAVDGFRPGAEETSDSKELAQSRVNSPQWTFFQRNGLDSRQHAVHRAALRFGHSFVVNEAGKDGGKSTARGLSPLTTAALFDDPANDIAPVAALNVTLWRDANTGVGAADMWLEKERYKVRFEGFTVKAVVKVGPHGYDECPVTRFAPEVDLDGRTVGLIEPLIPIQDRLNQTIFDLLIAQSYSSFKVRTITGMAPPMQMEPVYEKDAVTGLPVLDSNGDKIVVDVKPLLDPNTGQPVAAPIQMMAKSVMWAEDPDVKFGTLDETPLEGHIASAEMTIRQFSAVSQTPPHYMLGQIANLSAEALDAAQQSLDRLVDSVRSPFGEAWERVVRLDMQVNGLAGADDHAAEVIWADKDARAWAAFADGAGKLHTEIGIPQRGLWPRVPGVTQNELALWETLREEEDKEQQQIDALYRASGAMGAPQEQKFSSPPRRRGDDAL
jgi:hypothetical protein